MSTVRLWRASIKCIQSAGFWFSLKLQHQYLRFSFDYLKEGNPKSCEMLSWSIVCISKWIKWYATDDTTITLNKEEKTTRVEEKKIISQHLKCSIYILIVTDAIHVLHCHNNIYIIYCYSKKFHFTPLRASLWYSVSLFWKSPSVSTIWLNTICE